MTKSIPTAGGMKVAAQDEDWPVLQRVRPAWHADALCKEYPGLSWFPERGASSRAIREICRRCVVRAECAEAGRQEPYGWWGGVSERMRPRVRHPET